MQFFFTVVGIIAIGVIIGYLVTPLIFYLMEGIIYLLAVTVVIMRAILTKRLTPKDVFNLFPQLLCKFHTHTNRPIYESRNRESRIQQPHPTHKDRPCMESGRNVGVAIQPIAHSSGDSNYHPAKKDAFNMVKCPAIIKVSNTIHTVLLFYRSYYGHSTKVEKNHTR